MWGGGRRRARDNGSGAGTPAVPADLCARDVAGSQRLRAGTGARPVLELRPSPPRGFFGGYRNGAFPLAAAGPGGKPLKFPRRWSASGRRCRGDGSDKRLRRAAAPAAALSPRM